MYLPFDQNLVDSFTNILESEPPEGRKKELVIQEFLENNPELIPTTNLLNHQLHFESMVSQFPLDTSIRTDYAYLTKSSDRWRLTLVELEVPDKKIFTNSAGQVNTSAEFNAALNQVRHWKSFIEDNKAEVIRRLEPLLQPVSMRRNPIEIQYQLIIGRSAEKNDNESRKKYLKLLSEDSGIEILTYDTLINWYKNAPRTKKNILRLSRDFYKIHKMHVEPEHIFAYVGPDKLSLTTEQRDQLIASGYEMSKWSQGDLLTYNIKYASSTWQQELDNGSIFDLPGV